MGKTVFTIPAIFGHLSQLQNLFHDHKKIMNKISLSIIS